MKKIIVFLLLFCCFGCDNKKNELQEPDNIIEDKKEVSIVNVNSNSRPYAVVVNNSTVAVKVQTGLQKAYMVYEIPVEGGLTRLMAFYKDIDDDFPIGTIRSARHNFLDYVFEQDAIFVCYGWSHYAKDDMLAMKMNYLNGVVYANPFWRENPEKLASEHTAYTSINKIKDSITKKNFNSTTTQGLVLNYKAEEIDLSLQEKQTANTVNIPAGAETTKYIYDSNEKNYKRYVNDHEHLDYKTKEQYTAKNIIVQKINTKMASDNYYWDLETVGSGDGYFITNGVAVPINWSKETRKSKTKYTYKDQTEVILNDGITYIQLQSNKQKLTIE